MEMTEDRAFEAFVKAALEEGVAVEDGKVCSLERLAELAAQERRVRSRPFGVRWWRALLAASLAVAVAFYVLLSPREEPGASSVENAIELLCELDGIAKEDFGATSDGDLLLAWQEAPCADLH